MATPNATQGEWRRMSNKINVLKTSMRTNDNPANATMSSSETTDFHQGQEIKTITDFRQYNDLDQYLVSWHCPSKDIPASWECEVTVEAICKEALLKFWVDAVLSEMDESISTSTDDDEAPPSMNSTLFRKKLRQWISQPLIRKEKDGKVERSQSLLTPSKKRSRQFSSEDDLSDGDFYERKQRKLAGEPNENEAVSSTNVEIDSTQVLPFPLNREYDHFSGFSDLLKSDEIRGLMTAPQNEIGEVLTYSKLEDNPHSYSYVVTWFYVSAETADTLGLQEEVLQKHFGRTEGSGQRFQLHRTKHDSATIREVSNRKKAYSPKSDSDQSESSTIPPSESGTLDLIEYRILSDHLNDASCQTSIELDPFACLYCQSRKGDEKRVTSLRQRRSDKKDKDDDKKEIEKQSKLKKGHEMHSSHNGNDEEEDDDDLVPIEYEIEKILNYRKVEGTNVDEYYIRWKGFTSHYDTWEPFDNLSSCDKALIIFYVDRVAERKNVETEMQKMAASGNSSSANRLNKPPLCPIPEILMDKMSKAAPISDEEIEMAFKISKTIRKNGRWPKMKLRKMLLDLIGESIGPGSSLATAAAQDSLPIIRHQLLMLESERRKELILKDLKEWENQLNKVARGRPEIVVENNYDLAGPPSDFMYVNDNVLGNGVTFPDDPLEGCHCEDSCVKDKSQCCPGKHGKLLAYNSYKRLRVYPGYPIYECNKRCKCGPECANRVVQDGTISLLGTKLCIFRTSNERGWGVKTLRKIKRGTFVCLYAGEIITTEEAENRGKIYENQLGASYLFDLDYYAGDDDSCPYTIDATKTGNIAHFINHSCDPNLNVFNVWADCVDQNLPKLAFFALRDINKDEELTYDYGTHDDDPITGLNTTPAPLPVVVMPELIEGDGEESEENSMIPLTSSPSKNRLKPATASGVRRPCLCGASSCRKVLF